MTTHNIPANFINLCVELDNIYNFQNILIVHSNVTGIFLNSLFKSRKNIQRITYTVRNRESLLSRLRGASSSFDLICLDPYHEYNTSLGDFETLVPLLSEHGILVCHDCYPPTKRMANPNQIKGGWCGVTYAALIHISSRYPAMFYGLINRDFGLGIISKQKTDYTASVAHPELQLDFLKIFSNNYDAAYDYFITHVKDLVYVTE